MNHGVESAKNIYKHVCLSGGGAILESATNLWLLVLSILHNQANRIIKQA